MSVLDNEITTVSDALSKASIASILHRNIATANNGTFRHAHVIVSDTNSVAFLEKLRKDKEFQKLAAGRFIVVQDMIYYNGFFFKFTERLIALCFSIS